MIHKTRDDCPLWMDDFPEPGVCLCDNQHMLNDAITHLEDQIPAMVERLRRLYDIRDRDGETAESIVRRLFDL